MPIDVQQYMGEEPQLGFMWLPEIATFPNWGEDSRLKDYDIQAVSLPFDSYEAQSVYLAGRRQAFGGSVDSLTYTMEIHLFSNPRAVKWLRSWIKSIRSQSGFYGLPVDYKRNLEFRLLDTTGATVQRVKMTNSWPMAPSPLELNKSESTPLMLQLQMSADLMEELPV